MAYSLKEKGLEPDDVKKLLQFEELKQDEFECIDTEVGMKKVKEILCQAIQDTGEIWVVECFLQNTKKKCHDLITTFQGIRRGGPLEWCG
jgi:hypothetical protein